MTAIQSFSFVVAAILLAVRLRVVCIRSKYAWIAWELVFLRLLLG